MRKSLLPVSILFFLFLLPGCTSTPPATPWIPPSPVPGITSTFAPTATLPSLPYATGQPTPPCTPNLGFLEDLTILDDSVVAPGALLDKQWLVQNNGSCDWNESYHLRFIGGYLLGALEDQPLYPARAGTQANLRIHFSAPLESGAYISIWQAYSPEGFPFGESFMMKIIVQP